MEVWKFVIVVAFFISPKNNLQIEEGEETVYRTGREALLGIYLEDLQEGGHYLRSPLEIVGIGLEDPPDPRQIERR